jgi:site-specific recombinase XerD
MKLDACIEEYVTYRRSLGVGLHSAQVHLRAFATAMGDIEVARVNPKAVRRFLDGVGSTKMWWLRKHGTLTSFFRYAIRRGYTSESPLPTIKPRPSTRFVPYIYSLDDMRALLQAAGERHHEGWLLRPDTVRTLLLLLYGTGLRGGEAIRLNIEDVDLDDRVLTIRQTKFYKSRLVPIGTDLHGVLLNYRREHHRQHCRRAAPNDCPFLVDRNGRRVLLQTAEIVFSRIREYAGVKRPPDCRYQPRLHDLRHTFAVNRLLSWYREGKNVQNLLPHLATYLGHHSMHETQHYLSITSELWHEAALRFLQYASPRGRRG